VLIHGGLSHAGDWLPSRNAAPTRVAMTLLVTERSGRFESPQSVRWLARFTELTDEHKAGLVPPRAGSETLLSWLGAHGAESPQGNLRERHGALGFSPSLAR
jgi:hypothetical protein